MGGVEGDIAAESILGGKRVDLVPGDALAHPSVGIDGRGHAVVGIAQQPAPVLDGPHARHVQVLPGGAGVAVPPVIGDVHQDLGPVGGKVAHFIREHRLVADKHAVAVRLAAAICDLHRLPAGSPFELPDFPGKFFGEEQQIFVGHEFAEGDKVDLVVAPNEPPVGGEQHGRVVVLPALGPGWRSQRRSRPLMTGE